MYAFRRYVGTYGATDADASAVGGAEGFTLTNQSLNALHTMRLFRYHLSMSIFGAAGNVSFSPCLCWVAGGTGALIDTIEQDLETLHNDGVAYQTITFDHDYGDEGRTIYAPKGKIGYLGLVDRFGAGAALTIQASIDIQYGIDLDYRNMPPRVQVAA